MSLTVAQLVARLSADTSGFYKGMAVANASMVRSGSIIGRVAAGAGLATLAMGYMAVRSAGDFQQSMNILQAVSGGTTRQLSLMQKEALALGADLKLPNTSARDAADAMVELSKGGLSVNQILTATRGTIQLSLAANEDLTSSAQTVTRALKAFGLGGGQATTIANLLAAAANKSTAEFSDLQLGLQNASAQFSGAGYHVQTLTVALAELADKGLNGSIAGTSLKYMLQRLENPTTKAAAAIKLLNVHVANSKGEILPLRTIIGQFADGMAHMTNIQKQQTLNTIFGQRANAAMFDLVKGGIGTWDKYSKAIVGTNAAQKMAEARTKGFNGAIQGFESALSTLATVIGLDLLPTLTIAIKGMAKWIESLNTQAIINFINTIGHIVAAIVGFIAHSNAAQTAIGMLLAGFLAFKILLGIANMINGVRTAMIAMNAAMIASPVVLVIAAIAALAAGLFILYERSATARRIMNEIWAFMRSNLGPTFQWLKGVVTQLAQWIGAKFQQIRAYVHQNSAQIKSDLSFIWNSIVGQVRGTLNSLVSIFHVIWPALRVYLQGAWNAMKIIVTTSLKVIRDVVNIVMGALRGDWGRAWRGIKALVGDVLHGIIALIKNILSTGVHIAFELAKSIGASIGHGIIDGVKGLAGELKGAVTGAVNSAVGGIAGALHIHSPSGVTRDKIGKPLGEGIIVGFLLGLNDLPARVGDSLKAKLTAVQTQVSAQMQLFQSKFQTFQSYVDQAFDAISQQHLGPKGRLLQKLTDAHDAAQLKDALTQAKKAVVDAQAQMVAAQNATYDSAQARNDAIAAAQQALTDALKQKAEAQYQIQIASLEKAAAEEDKQYQARRNLQKQHLDAMLANFEVQMQKHPERAAYWQKRITQTLQKYGVTYQAAGEAMGTAFAVGLKEAEHAIEAEIKKIANIIARYLRLHSPAETGPLSDLDRWWDSFAKTLVQGLDPALIRSSALGMAQAAQVSASGSYTPGLTSSSTGGPGTGSQIIVPVSGNTFLTNERETLRAISDALAKVAPTGDSRLQLKTQ